MADDESDYIILDLGELSTTNFGRAVLNASLDLRGSQGRAVVELDIFKKELQCRRVLRAGTHIIYDESGQAIGTSDEEYVVDDFAT